MATARLLISDPELLRRASPPASGLFSVATGAGPRDSRSAVLALVRGVGSDAPGSSREPPFEVGVRVVAAAAAAAQRRLLRRAKTFLGDRHFSFDLRELRAFHVDGVFVKGEDAERRSADAAGVRASRSANGRDGGGDVRGGGGGGLFRRR